MRDLLNLIRWMLLGLFRSRTSLRAENLALRHQLNVLHRSSPLVAARRQAEHSTDRLGVLEAGRNIDRRTEGQRDQRSDTGYAHETAADVILAHDSEQSTMQNAKLL